MMKVFLSWSGQRSKGVAELLNDWLRCVLQAIRPWISSRDIDRGALWFSEISEQLVETGIGIVCLTNENKTKPWILFEAGALAKGLSHNRVCTFLIDVAPTDIEDSLAQFNHTFPNKESMWTLVRTLNNLLQTNALDERVLVNVFETYWPQFESSFAEVLARTPAVPSEPRTDESLLTEILENTRGLAAKVREIETRLPTPIVINTRPGAVKNVSLKEYVKRLTEETGGTAREAAAALARDPLTAENVLAKLAREAGET